MSRDPLDLLGGQQQPTTSSSGGGPGWLVVGLLLGVAVVFMLQHYQPDGGGDKDKDKQEQVEPQPKPDPQPQTQGKTVVLIYEQGSPSIEQTLLLRSLQESDISYRALDSDITDPPVPQVIAAAKSAGVVPPFVAVTDQNDKPVRFQAWTTATSLDQVKGLLNGRTP